MKIITTYKNNDDSPILGLTPLITITNITDMNNPTVIINADIMLEIGSGFYGYEFTTYKEGQEYTVFIDANTAIPGKYQYGTIEKYDLSHVEGNLHINQILRILSAVMVGHSNGGGTPNIQFTDINNTKTRVNALVDELGNRLSVAINPD